MLPDRQSAVKTGTTNDFHDAWTIGYTPSLVTGVWVGNNDNKEMKEGADGSKLAAPIWNEFMRHALEGTAIETFAEPDPILIEKSILRGVVAPGVTVKIDKTSGKLATADTPEEFVEERTYRQLHDTLFFIDKNDPQGPAPADPRVDPQFASWEEAVQKWAKENNFISESPPTEYDTSHSQSLRPIVSFTNLSDGDTVNSRKFTVQISASAPRGQISRSEYLVDGKVAATILGQGAQAEIALGNNLGKGEHTLEVRVYDDIGNRGSASIVFNLTADADPYFIEWLNPTENITVNSSNFPLDLAVKLYDQSISEVVITATSVRRDFFATIGTSKTENNEAKIIWSNKPPVGAYRVEVKTNSGIILSPSILITVQ